MPAPMMLRLTRPADGKRRTEIVLQMTDPATKAQLPIARSYYDALRLQGWRGLAAIPEEALVGPPLADALEDDRL